MKDGLKQDAMISLRWIRDYLRKEDSGYSETFVSNLTQLIVNLERNDKVRDQQAITLAMFLSTFFVREDNTDQLPILKHSLGGNAFSVEQKDRFKLTARNHLRVAFGGYTSDERWELTTQSFFNSAISMLLAFCQVAAMLLSIIAIAGSVNDSSALRLFSIPLSLMACGLSCSLFACSLYNGQRTIQTSYRLIAAVMSVVSELEGEKYTVSITNHSSVSGYFSTSPRNSRLLQLLLSEDPLELNPEGDVSSNGCFV